MACASASCVPLGAVLFLLAIFSATLTVSGYEEIFLRTTGAAFDDRDVFTDVFAQTGDKRNGASYSPRNDMKPKTLQKFAVMEFGCVPYDRPVRFVNKENTITLTPLQPPNKEKCLEKANNVWMDSEFSYEQCFRKDEHARPAKTEGSNGISPGLKSSNSGDMLTYDGTIHVDALEKFNAKKGSRADAETEQRAYPDYATVDNAKVWVEYVDIKCLAKTREIVLKGNKVDIAVAPFKPGVVSRSECVEESDRYWTGKSHGSCWTFSSSPTKKERICPHCEMGLPSKSEMAHLSILPCKKQAKTKKACNKYKCVWIPEEDNSCWTAK